MDFSVELYREHLEEASFLYEQRGTLFSDAEVTWPDIGDFEERFARHIEALAVGEETALQVCRDQAAKGDAGELHAAVRVFCRHKRLDLLQEVWRQLDIADTDRVLAVSDALKSEWPAEWTAKISDLWSNMPDVCVALLPRVIGFKRLATMDRVLIAALSDAPDGHLYELLWSLGRIKARPAVPALSSFLAHSDTTIGAAAALALLRIGEKVPHGQDIMHCGPSDFRHLLRISLAGDQNDVAPLIDQLDNIECASDPAFALGVLGEGRAVGPLIALADSEEAGESAALALNLITGAGLYEEVFVADPIDPDEFLDEEAEKLKKSDLLTTPDRQHSTTTVRLSQDPGAWQAWWKDNYRRFQPGVRYRNGRPVTPECVLENLCRDKSPLFVRQIAYEELAVRYGIDVPFETDMPVKDQMKAIDQMAQCIAQSRHQWEEGRWYFAGQVMG